jgi:archaemetzincin
MISLISIGEVDTEVLEELEETLSEIFEQKIIIAGRIELSKLSWYKERQQYLGDVLLDSLPNPDTNDIILGITDVDIFALGLDYVFGEADIESRKAVISVTRLRQEYYGFSSVESIFRARILKEAVHEIGHTLGLKHCFNRHCVMHFSNSLMDTDVKDWRFCNNCEKCIRTT